MLSSVEFLSDLEEMAKHRKRDTKSVKDRKRKATSEGACNVSYHCNM